MAQITYLAAKQYAQDRLQDSVDAKAVRQAERVVKTALKRIARSRDWQWYRVRHRLSLFPPVEYSEGLAISAGATNMRLLSGTAFSAALQHTTFFFSANVEQHRIISVDGSVAYFHASEPYRGQTSVGAYVSNDGGTFAYDRVALPDNFKRLSKEPTERSFLVELQRVDIGEMQHLHRTWMHGPSDPIYYCINKDQARNKYEMWVWPAPARMLTEDIIIHVWPETPSADTDVLDFDPDFEDLLYAAMDLECALELKRIKDIPYIERQYRTKLRECKAAERKDVAGGPASGASRYYPSKQQRSNHFTDVP